MVKRVEIIYIDDNQEMLEITKQIVTSRFHDIEFETFSDYKNFLYYIDQTDCDLIGIFDFNMPNYNGVELIKMIQKKASFKKFIVFSTHPSMTITKEISRQGLSHLNITTIDKLCINCEELIDEIYKASS